MASVKFMVLYPIPTDIEKFEKLYLEEHIPMVTEKVKGKIRFVTTRVFGDSKGNKGPYHRIAEIHFPSVEAAQESAISAEGQATMAHAISISTGGHPVFLIAQEETLDFEDSRKK